MGERGRSRLLTVALVVYLAVVAWGTLGPQPGEEIDRVAHQAKAAERAMSGEPAAPAAAEPRFAGLSGEDVGNIAMFVPFGLLVPLRFRRWRWWTLPAGVAISGAIELTQLALLPHRSPEWTDVRWNSLGVLVGVGLWAVGAGVLRLPDLTRG